MLKKALIASAVLAATSGVAFANGGTYAPVPAEPQHEGGFYIGIDVSRDVSQTDIERTSSIFINDNPLTFTSTDEDLGLSGFNGEIFVGYGCLWDDHWYIGAEIWASVDSLSGDRSFEEEVVDEDGDFDFGSTVVGSHKLRLNNSFGIAVLPGFKISDSTLLYARIGYINSRFEFTTDFDNNSGFFGENSIDFNHSFHKNQGGLQLGLGLEAMVTNNVSIRGEYDWNTYSNITRDRVNNFGFDDFDVDVDVFNQDKVKPRVDQFKLAAIYHFYS